MRTRLFVLAASVTSLAAALIAQGCGETEETAVPSTDAGTDVTDSGKKETAPPVEEDASPCDTSADFTKEIPDAAIADGASTTGLCVGCAQKNCKKYIDDCNANCECQGLAADALECYAKSSGDIVGCLGKFANSSPSKQTQQTGIGLFTCLNGNCKDECQTEALNPDAGDAGDGGDADAN
jgi:hypothetical protein